MYKIDSDIVLCAEPNTEIQVHQVFWCCCWSKLGLWVGRRLGWGGDIQEDGGQVHKERLRLHQIGNMVIAPRQGSRGTQSYASLDEMNKPTGGTHERNQREEPTRGTNMRNQHVLHTMKSPTC